MIEKKNCGTVNDSTLWIVTLKNSSGMSVELTNYSGAIMCIFASDKNGKFKDVVLGYDKLEDYFGGGSSQGALVGRYANRIGGGKFSINGTTYELFKNDGNNTLHGGKIGFNKRIWIIEDEGENFVTFGYFSPDGEENFPGNFKIQCKYTLTEDNELKLEYVGESDKDTVVNMTNHVYFNLGGYDSGKINNHILQIFADKYTPVSPELIPTGEIADVKNTVFDFTKPKKIGEDIASGKIDGYDHNFVFGSAGKMKKAAYVVEPISGRTMTVFTDKPAMQLYTANGLSGETGKDGVEMTPQTAFCLETQYSPDSPNKPQFGDCILHKGQIYSFTTIYKFGINSD